MSLQALPLATLGVVSGVSAAVSWAVGSTIIATLSGRAPSGALNLFKFAFGAVVLLAVDAALNGGVVFSQSSSAWRLMALSAVIGLGIGDNVYYRAIETLGVSRAMIFLSTAPVFATLLGAIFLAERVTLVSLIGAALTLFGVLVVVLTRTHAGRARITTAGVAFGVGAAMCQALGSLLSRSAMNDGLPALTSSWMRLAIAVVASIGFGTARPSLRPWFRGLSRRDVLIPVVVSTCVGTIFGLVAAQAAIKMCASTGIASTTLATSPVFVLPLAHRYAGEPLTPRAVFGAVVAVVGVFVLATAPG